MTGGRRQERRGYRQQKRGRGEKTIKEARKPGGGTRDFVLGLCPVNPRRSHPDKSYAEKSL